MIAEIGLRAYMLVHRMLAFFLIATSLFADQEPTFKSDLQLVTVPFSVIDADGNFVQNLKRGDFKLYDNGKQVPITQFWQDLDLPLTIAFVTDISGSQRRVVEKHKKNISQFLRQVLHQKDKATLVTVAGQVRVLQDFTGSADQLQDAVELITTARQGGERLDTPCKNEKGRGRMPCGGSIIWNGVFYSARLKLKPEDGRKAIVLLTDGEDTGSDHSLVHAIEAAQGADAVVFPIQERSGAARKNKGKTKRNLLRLATETGGVLFDGNEKSPEFIFSEIEKELRSQYVLAFTPAASQHDGKFHKLEVRVTKPKMKARSRAGYFAPTN